MSDDSTAGRPPVHLWIVGTLAALWNAYGCVDYLMKQARSASYLASLPPEQVTMLAQMPLWANIAWAIGVWGGLSGCVLLLLRKRWAAHVFRLSLLGAAVGTAYQVRHTPQPMSSQGWVLAIAILLVCVALLIYARWQSARGVLR